MLSLTERRNLEIKVQAVIELRKRKSLNKTVFGIVSPTEGLIKSLTKKGNKWIEVESEPDIYIAEKLEPVLKTNKRFIIIIGGRGSTKSVGVVDICIVCVNSNPQ